MHQKEIVAAIKDLLPEIRKSGSAEDTLIKYARTNNLSPAQLEKVAQTYNIAKTVNFMEKSANRGASFPVVDVPSLLKKYASHTSVKKASASAVVKSAKVGAIDYDDINSWIDPVKKSASQPSTGVPNFNRELRDEDVAPLELSAKIEDTTFLDKMAASEVFIEARLLKDLEATLQDDVREKMAFFREAFNKISAPNFAHLGEDVVLLNPEAVPALEKVSFYLSDTGVKISHTDTTVEKLASAKLAKDRTGFLGHVVELQGFYNDLEKLALYKEAARSKKDRPKWQDVTNSMYGGGSVDPNAVTPASAPEREAARLKKEQAAVASNAEKARIAAEKDEEAEKAEQERADKAWEPELKPWKSDDDLTGGDTEGHMYERNLAGLRDAEGKALEEEEYAKTDAPVAMAALDAVKKPQITDLSVDREKKVDSNKAIDTSRKEKEKDTFNKLLQTPKAIVGQFKTLRNVIDSIASQKSNHGQRHMDEHIDTSKSMMHLQRLMVTDPIISEADPDMVVSLFNTLKGANSDIVQDPNMLRFALREAIQYESVPPHTYKDLTEIDLKGTQGKKEKQELADNHYRISTPSRVDYKPKPNA